MKIDFLINDEDRKDVEDWINELEQKKDLKIGDSTASGGLGVMLEDILSDGTRVFTIYREIWMVWCKK
jgi:hypothetical protein